MATLSRVLESVFQSRTTRGSYSRNPFPENTFANMIIPLWGSIVEIPVLALDKWREKVLSGAHSVQVQQDAFVAELADGGVSPYYSTLDANFRDIMTMDYCRNKLTKIPLKGELFPYYVTRGAVFTHELSPVMLCSWKIRMEQQGDTVLAYPEKPIYRLSPHCWMVDNALTRMLKGKVLKEIMYQHVWCLPWYGEGERMAVSALIEDIPFTVQKPAIPSISTTNEELIQIAKDYRREIAI